MVNSFDTRFAGLILALLFFSLPLYAAPSSSSSSSSSSMGFESTFQAEAVKIAKTFAGADKLVNALKTLDRRELKKQIDMYDFPKTRKAFYLKLACYYLGRNYRRAGLWLKKKKKIKRTKLSLLAAKVLSKNQITGYGKAISYYRSVLKKNKKNVLAHIGLGEIFLLKNLLNLGKKEFKKALKVDPDNIEALIGMINFYARSGELENAFDAGRELITSHSTDARSYTKLAQLYEQYRGKAEMEIILANYRQAIKYDKNNAERYVDICLAMLSVNYDFTAAGYVRKAFELEPGNAKVLWMNGLFKETKGDLPGALKFYRAALNLDSGSAHYHYSLANILAAIPNTDFVPQTRRVRKRLYLRIKNFKKAIAEYKRTLKIDHGYRFNRQVISRINYIEEHQSEREKERLRTANSIDVEQQLLMHRTWKLQ